MKSSRSLPFHTRRDAWVEVDLGAIEHNTLLVKNCLPEDVALMAVIKADAYGHGAVMVQPTLEASGVSMLGVAAMDEALQIREAGVSMPILVLGLTPDWAMHYAVEHDVQLTICTPAHVASLERVYEATGKAIQVHIKVDTGMHRIGVHWKDAVAFVEDCQNKPFLQVKGVFSHLADTDNTQFTQLQMERWLQIIRQLKSPPPFRHLSNSAATWHYPLQEVNMVRVGISLFGYAGDGNPVPQAIRPAMGLKARIVHLQELESGEGVSYGQTFRNHTTSYRRIATLPLGYADGVPRGLSNKIQGIYQGQFVPQVGIITMDQLMVDVTDCPEAQVGDVVTLLGSSHGSHIGLNVWAKALNTIEYELMCALRVRLPKTCIR